MKTTLKVFRIVLLIMTILSVTSTVALAAPAAAPAADDVNLDPSQFTGASANTTGITTIGNQIITIVSTVGSIASVIVLVVLGLKYMMGSAEEKAEYKKTLIPYIIGAALVFAASAIAGIIFGFAQNLGGNNT